MWNPGLMNAAVVNSGVLKGVQPCHVWLAALVQFLGSGEARWLVLAVWGCMGLCLVVLVCTRVPPFS